MQTKVNFLKIIKNLWINMLSPTKKVLFEYMTLLAKMARDHVEFHITQMHFDLLSKNVILLGLVKLFPSKVLQSSLSKYKLVKIVVVQVLKSVENKHTFSLYPL